MKGWRSANQARAYISEAVPMLPAQILHNVCGLGTEGALCRALCGQG